MSNINTHLLRHGRVGIGAGLTLALVTTMARAQDPTVFDLGEINVTAPAPSDSQEKGQSTDNGSALGATTITNQQMFKFDLNTLDQAAATLAPSVAQSSSGNARNESELFVRGFNRYQVPLSIDGVRIYLPYDDNLDFAQFLTADISEIQIAKGYVSVLDGPGAIGGAINLVSRKPQKLIEGEIRQGTEFGDGRFLGASTNAYLGTRQPNWYLSGSANLVKSDGFPLSASFTPTASQGSGLRDNSETLKAGGSAHFGLTPNATDEYSINFIKQVGEKDAPFQTDLPVTSQKNWRWPSWNVQNIYFLSNTAIGDSSYVKTRLYYSRFDNSLYAYNPNGLFNLQTYPGAFRSYYYDYGIGGSVEAGTNFGKFDTLKGTLQYRRDTHQTWEWATSGVEPQTVDVTDTYTTALENTVHITNQLDFILGAAYNWRDTPEAQYYSSTAANKIAYYATNNLGAPDGQGALIWRYSESDTLSASISSRERFPTMWELYSSQFGAAVPNPGLQPERATNYQINWSRKFGRDGEVTAAVFYSDVQNLIESVELSPGTSQNQNVGTGYFVGAEASGSYRLRDDLSVGGNISFIRRHIDDPQGTGATLPTYEPTGVPFAQGFLYVTWSPLRNLELTPSLQIADSRWTENETSSTYYYYQTGAYHLVNFIGSYQFDNHFTLEAGVKNLLDQNYALSDGYPESGRTFFLKGRLVF
jgi:iron complex outermembrane recepter protein